MPALLTQRTPTPSRVSHYVPVSLTSVHVFADKTCFVSAVNHLHLSKGLGPQHIMNLNVAYRHGTYVVQVQREDKTVFCLIERANDCRESNKYLGKIVATEPGQRLLHSIVLTISEACSAVVIGIIHQII
jgi:hypothetical protein